MVQSVCSIEYVCGLWALCVCALVCVTVCVSVCLCVCVWGSILGIVLRIRLKISEIHMFLKVLC